MKSITKLHPFTFLLVIFYLLLLSELVIGTWVGLFNIIIYIFGIILFKDEKEKLFPIVTMLNILFIQFYSLFARLALLSSGVEDVKHGSMEGAIASGIILIFFIVSAPFFSLIPNIQLAKVSRKYIWLMLPTILIASYWLFLFKAGRYF